MARMTSSSRPGGKDSDSMAVTKPASYLRPSCSRISRLVSAGSSMMLVGMVSVAMATDCLCVGEAQVDALRGIWAGFGFAVWRWRQHLREGDAAQGVDHHVVDAVPVGSYAAGLFDAAVAGVDAAFGHAERPFQRNHDFEQANRFRRPREPIAA